LFPSRIELKKVRRLFFKKEFEKMNYRKNAAPPVRFEAAGVDSGKTEIISRCQQVIARCARFASRRFAGRAALPLAAGIFGLFLLAVPCAAQKTGDDRPKNTKTPAVKRGPSAERPTDENAVRPFQVRIPNAALADLRRRLQATRWPEMETVEDRSQGVRLAKLQELVRYWATDYDWRKVEARLNALPQFVTEIDGLDIHFIHVRSKHPNAMPLIVTHGWPGSIIEQLKIIAPLTDPTAHRGRAEDAFDVVIPSIPGFGFSGKPTGPGWGPERVAKAWAELMKRLGYSRYVAQGGDWGSPVSNAMARQAPDGLLGIHVNLPPVVPPEIAAALAGGPVPAGLSEKERAALESLDVFFKKYMAYASMMGTRPQTIGYALTDSPVGLAAWIYDYNNGEPERLIGRDDVLDDITLYWLTNSAASSGRLYWETGGRSVTVAAAQKTDEVSLPVAITVFPGEVYRAPETWARRAYRNLIYFNEAEKGGHFAAWEQPQLFAEEIRAAFRSLRQPAPQSGTTRTELQRRDLAVPGFETVQARIDFEPGASFGRHSHPGEEIVYVLEGTLEYQIDGRPPVTLKAGEVLFIPAGAVHAAKNVGRDRGSELATYVVEKGKPLVVRAE
jgi:quercetin dioxygenase-like cupin family protein